MRALTAVAVAVPVGASLGAASRWVVPGAEARVAAALFTAFGLAAAFAPAFECGAATATARLRRVGAAALVAFVGAWTAATVAGDAAAVGASAVVASAAALASASAALLRSLGAGGVWASFGGALVPGAAAALVFVADPFVDWHAGEGSLGRARAVTAASPLASIGADVGVDWQRSRWLYDGPAPGTPGLSVIGQFYPSDPPPAWLWCLAAAAAASGTALAARPRSSMAS